MRFCGFGTGPGAVRGGSGVLVRLLPGFGHGQCLNNALKVSELLGDVIASVGQDFDFCAGLGKEHSGFGAAGIGVRSGRRQGSRCLVPHRAAVFVGFGLERR